MRAAEAEEKTSTLAEAAVAPVAQPEEWGGTSPEFAGAEDMTLLVVVASTCLPSGTCSHVCLCVALRVGMRGGREGHRGHPPPPLYHCIGPLSVCSADPDTSTHYLSVDALCRHCERMG